MTFRLFAGGAFALLLSAAVFAQANERVLYVSAWDHKTHAPVTGLSVDAFTVREDDRQREVLRVTPATSPMAIAVLVDNTQAANDHIADTRKALLAFVKTLSGIGPISIIGIADRPTILRDYTTDQTQLVAGVNRVFAMPGSGATLLDAIVETSKGLEKRTEDRAAIVILTSENVEFSTRHYADVLESLAKGGAMLHVVIRTTPAGTALNDPARNRASVFDRGPRDSGGTRTDVLTSQAFEQKMLEVAELLKSQYRVVYARPQMLIPPEKIVVESVKPGVDANGGPARGQATR